MHYNYINTCTCTCRYIQLKIILAPFKTTRFHPGHFEQEVTETTTVHGLRCLVETHMEDSVDSVAMFRDSSCSKEAFLDPSWCLGHCGLAGGTKDSPNPAEVFYDYFPTINRCPILMDESHIPDFIIWSMVMFTYFSQWQQVSILLWSHNLGK